jgi:hypothetical protein
MRRSGCFTSGGGVAGINPATSRVQMVYWFGHPSVSLTPVFGSAHQGGSGFVSSLSAASQLTVKLAVNAMSGFNSEQIRFQKGGVRTRAF